MSRRRKALTPTIGVGLVLAGLPLSVLLASPGSAEDYFCYAFANKPYTYASYEVRGTGGQAGCHGGLGGDVITTELKWERALHTDPVLDGRSGTYENITWLLSSGCVSGAHDYFMQAQDNHKSVSDHKRVTC